MGRGIKKNKNLWLSKEIPKNFSITPSYLKDFIFPFAMEKLISRLQEVDSTACEEEDLGRFFLEDKIFMKTVRVFQNLEVREISGLHFIVEYDSNFDVVKPKFHLDFSINQIPESENTVYGVLSVSIGRKPEKTRIIFNDLIRDLQESILRERKKC